jgi:hypothetical protein
VDTDDVDMPPAVAMHLSAIRAVLPASCATALDAIERFAVIGAVYSKAQSDASKARKGRTELRDVAMAAEFLKRRGWSANDGYGSTAIMVQVGRLPRFHLQRQGAINAIKRGLKHHSLSHISSHPGEVDSARVNVRLPRGALTE